MKLRWLIGLALTALLVPFVPGQQLALAADAALALGQRHPTGIELVGLEVRQAKPANEAQSVAYANAMVLARKNPSELGYPWIDSQGRLVQRAASVKGRQLAGSVAKGNLAAVLDLAGVRTFQDLERIKNELIDLEKVGVEDGQLIWRTEPDDEHNRIIATVSRISDSLLGAIAKRYGTQVVAVRVQERPNMQLTSGSRQDDESPYSGGAMYYAPVGGCTVGFGWSFGYITAGHCAPDGGTSYNPDAGGGRDTLGYTRAGQDETQTVGFGTVLLPGQNTFHGDLAVIRTDDSARVSNTIYVGAANSSTKWQVTEMWQRRATIGDQYCTGGYKTGELCGWTVTADRVTEDTYEDGNYVGTHRNVSLGSKSEGSGCTIKGDSGGPVYTNRGDGTVAAKGITSGGGTWAGSCLHVFTDIWDAQEAFGGSLKTTPPPPLDPCNKANPDPDCDEENPPADGSYGITENGVSVRANNSACQNSPSTGNCPTVLGTMNIGHRITPSCQKSGQTVGSNPYWVYGSTSIGQTGWIPSWYIDYPDNVLPGVPICNSVPGDNPVVSIGAKPSMIAYGDSIYVFARGSDGTLRQWGWTPAQGWWLNDHSLNGNIVGSPAVSVYKDTINILARGSDNNLYNWSYSPAGGWFAHNAYRGGPISSDPTIGVYSGGFYTFARGGDGTLRQWGWNEGSGWWLANHSLNGNINGSPVVTVYNDTGHVLARGSDNNLYDWSWSPAGVWVAHNAYLGGPIAASPTATTTAAGIQAFAKSGDGTLRQWGWTAGSGWVIQNHSLNGNINGSPPALLYKDNLHIMARGSDNNLYNWSWNPSGWYSYNEYRGGPIAGDPTIAAYKDSVHVFARGNDGTLRQWVWAENQGWVYANISLGGSLG